MGDPSVLCFSKARSAHLSSAAKGFGELKKKEERRKKKVE
jgi:hypothetical protein